MASEETKDSRIRQRVLLGTVSNYIGQFVSFGALLFLTPFLLHHLGETIYGLWVLIGSVVAYGSILDLGIWGAVIKYVAEYRARGDIEQARNLVATAFSLYTLIGLIIILLSLMIAPHIPNLFNVPSDQRSIAATLVKWMGLGVGVSLPGMTPMAVLRGLQRYDVVNLVDVITILFSTMATVVALLLGGGVIGLVAVNVSGIFLTFALSVWFIQRAAPELRVGWRGANRRLIRTVLSYSWPLFVKDLASRLQTKTDEITIGAFLPVRTIAPYNIARRLSEITHILTKQFMKVLLPLASELHAENDLARLRSLYMTGTRVTLAISAAIGGTLIILARPILTLWLGHSYAGAAFLVVILTLASLIATGQWPAGAVLQGMAKHRLLAATSLGSGFANLGLSLALVRPFGLTGVALGTLIPNMIEFGIVLSYTMRVLGVSTAEALKEIFLPALSPAVLMVLMLYALRQFAAPSSLLLTFIVAGIGLLIYAIAYISIGASRVEKQAYRGFAFGMFRFARAQFKRLG